ncbi:MAG TPA: hypothetical protein VMT58_08445 [Candidatus Binataceae bacterium]|nr:hypothetical protein [Candidatus Binataceae bacterium]
MLGVSWEHFGPVCLLLILGSQALNRRAQRIRWRNEVRSLRASLKVGLHSLRDLYGENLHAVAHSKRSLMSGRQQLNLLRTQLGRLPSLKEREAETVMLACIAAERAESVLEAARKSLAPADVVIQRRDEKRAMAESAYQAACAALESAETLLAATDSTRTKHSAAADQGRPLIASDGGARSGANIGKSSDAELDDDLPYVPQQSPPNGRGFEVADG